jgi:hypothetical protein
MIRHMLPPVVVGVVVAVVHCYKFYVNCVSKKNCRFFSIIHIRSVHKKFHKKAKMADHVIEVGVDRVAAIILFTLIHFENRVEAGSYNCIICLEEICVEDMVGDLSCNHVFCHECIQQWALLDPSCPCCRTPIPMVWIVHWRF